MSTNGYMYGCNSVSGDIMQLDIASGSENVVYSPQSAGIMRGEQELLLLEIREYCSMSGIRIRGK